jgi:hypothetical protein
LLIASWELSYDQRNQVRIDAVKTRRNYWYALNQIFHDDDPKIEKAVADMKEAQASLEKLTKNLASIAKVHYCHHHGGENRRRISQDGGVTLVPLTRRSPFLNVTPTSMHCSEPNSLTKRNPISKV